MPLKLAPFKRRPVTLTPLIDIIFLLLLFFMLSSTSSRFAEIPLLNAGSGTASETAPLFVQLTPDTVVLNGTVLPLEALVPAINALGAEETQPLLVTLHGEVSSQRLVDLLTVMRRAADLAVSVLE
ncbi:MULTISPECIES: biopolymer transporter ExbD [unclassified Roseobacter]|uniref:biopolymer transporter ExbD n=1 Tax=unclassified Roseobacter TaxID=196798 RepID=UPI00149238A1|nr:MULTISPECIES: biopolymer transporter ExbD [unclassified Roseobacter]